MCQRGRTTRLARRVRLLAAMAMTATAFAAPPAVMAAPPAAASPHDQAYLVCANGYEGDPGDCKRVCQTYLKQGGNPLGTMKGTCLRRVSEKPGQVAPEPD